MRGLKCTSLPLTRTLYHIYLKIQDGIMHKMNDKKLFILGIDNNPKVWYNKRGGTAESRFSGFWQEKFLCKLPIDKIAGMRYNRNFGPLGRWRADQPNLLLYHIQEGFVNSEIKQK